MHLILSVPAKIENLYACSPIIVGDKFTDPEVISFLGAKLSECHAGLNDSNVYVMRGVMRNVLDALEDLGYSLINVDSFAGYIMFVLHKGSDDSDASPKTNTSEDMKVCTAKLCPVPSGPLPRSFIPKGTRSDLDGIPGCSTDELDKVSKTQRKRLQIDESTTQLVKATQTKDISSKKAELRNQQIQTSGPPSQNPSKTLLLNPIHDDEKYDLPPANRNQDTTNQALGEDPFNPQKEAARGPSSTSSEEYLKSKITGEKKSRGRSKSPKRSNVK